MLTFGKTILSNFRLIKVNRMKNNCENLRFMFIGITRLPQSIRLNIQTINYLKMSIKYAHYMTERLPKLSVHNLVAQFKYSYPHRLKK